MSCKNKDQRISLVHDRVIGELIGGACNVSRLVLSAYISVRSRMKLMCLPCPVPLSVLRL